MRSKKKKLPKKELPETSHNQVQISMLEASEKEKSESMIFVQCPACSSAYSNSTYCCDLGGYWLPK